MNPTAEELRIVTASRLLEDHAVVFAGVGAPLLASALARRRQAPHLTVVLEGGIVGADFRPAMLPISTNEMRAAVGAAMLTDITDVFLLAQAGYFRYGFLGGAQIDMHGNINTSMIGDHQHPTVRLPGSGGANDIASLCSEVLVLTAHEPRRFVERVDFVTSPGWLTGGSSRPDAGLHRGGPAKVVTELALMDFEPVTRRMRVAALQPNVTIEEVEAATGFELLHAGEMGRLDPPTDSEIATLRDLSGDGT